MNKSFLVIIILLLSFNLAGCGNSLEKEAKELRDDELLVKHWQVLSDEKKLSLIKDMHTEEHFNVDYTGVENDFIMLYDGGFRNTPYYDHNLKKAMKEYHENREITEKSK
ncbi:hypothetical protein [Bacillus sp. AK031]